MDKDTDNTPDPSSPMAIAPAIKFLKRSLPWFVVGITVMILGGLVRHHWQEVRQLQLQPGAGRSLLGAALITMGAQGWSGYVWQRILVAFHQPFRPVVAIAVYLHTNLGKYLPGNIWHFYGRIVAVQRAGGSGAIAGMATLLEPLLLAAAALVLGLGNYGQGGQGEFWRSPSLFPVAVLPLVGMAGILLGLHPWVLNRCLVLLSRKKKLPSTSAPADLPQIDRYPWSLLLGALGFLLLRSGGFWLTCQAVAPIPWTELPRVVSCFSWAWLWGFIVPGAPGGLGVFEVTAIALLPDSLISRGDLLAVVALFRGVSLASEIVTGAWGWWYHQAIAKKDLDLRRGP